MHRKEMLQTFCILSQVQLDVLYVIEIIIVVFLNYSYCVLNKALLFCLHVLDNCCYINFCQLCKIVIDFLIEFKQKDGKVEAGQTRSRLSSQERFIFKSCLLKKCFKKMLVLKNSNWTGTN